MDERHGTMRNVDRHMFYLLKEEPRGTFFLYWDKYRLGEGIPNFTLYPAVTYFSNLCLRICQGR